MRLSLEIGQKQQLSISPQLQQAIRLLSLSSLEMMQEIQQAIEENPLLEMEEHEQKDMIESLQITTAITSQTIQRNDHGTGDIDDPYRHTTAHETLFDHIVNQLQHLNLNSQQQFIALAIVDSINSDGYLQVSADDILTTVQGLQQTVDANDVNYVLSLVQSLEPAGIAARSIDECILLQLYRLPHSTDGDRAIKLITNHFGLFSKRDYHKLKKSLKWDDATLERVIALIKSLNPRPGANFTPLIQHYISPDIVVRKHQQSWQVILNPNNTPTPRINHHYASLINHSKNKQDNTYVKHHLKEAKWFIKSIENRHNTLLNVAKAIMDYQSGFLEHGIVGMKPLRLATIADIVEMHESTISRVTTKKYIMTPHGIYELKHFFSSQIKSDNGQACSSTAIKAVIKQLIKEERPNKPLSDLAITELLKQRGINIARRTITKYREALAIPSSTDRKILAK